MHSALTRLNAIFSYTVLVTAGMLAFNFLSTFWLPSNPTASLNVTSITLRTRENDYAGITFDLKSDLSSLFNWNTKQLYISVTAEYKTEANEVNQIVVWDRIIEYVEDSHVDVTNARNKYELVDQGRGLLGNEIRFLFNWEVCPITGITYNKVLAEHKVDFPESYIGIHTVPPRQ